MLFLLCLCFTFIYLMNFLFILVFENYLVVMIFILDCFDIEFVKWKQELQVLCSYDQFHICTNVCQYSCKDWLEKTKSQCWIKENNNFATEIYFLSIYAKHLSFAKHLPIPCLVSLSKPFFSLSLVCFHPSVFVARDWSYPPWWCAVSSTTPWRHSTRAIWQICCTFSHECRWRHKIRRSGMLLFRHELFPNAGYCRTLLLWL